MNVLASSRRPLDGLQHLKVTVASGDALDVRHFRVAERMSSLFEITLVVVSDDPDVDFETVAGQPMSFSMRKGLGPLDHRAWTGVCSRIEQTAAEERGLSTYSLTLVPELWLLTQRRNYRMFQHASELEIVKRLLAEWGIVPVERLSGIYKKRKYRVQYGESDYAFVCRMLEDAGISFYFETADDQTTLVLDDAPQRNASRPPVAFRDGPMDAGEEHVTRVRIGRRIRPGQYTVRDHDHRRSPRLQLIATAGSAPGIEARLERYHYVPGAFLFESDKGEPTPHADDKGGYRTDEREAKQLAQRRLAAKRAGAKIVSFETNTLDPAPGVVLRVLDHPKGELAAGTPLLVLASELSGTHDGAWPHACEAVSAEQPYRPPLATPKPKVAGVESATVVGPPGEEIHTDELGRVRVHFHWDRESRMDDRSSCWIHVSQPWGGTGYGVMNLPRVGQEVLVEFLGGDPDRPIIVGRVYTNLQKVPYVLPAQKTLSGWKSCSTGGTGGYNEIAFDDAAGKELVRTRAERDLCKRVKRDESSHVGRDRARFVTQNEEITVGKNRTKRIAGNEDESVGLNRTTTVGMNRTSRIGAVESTTVGEMFVVAVAPPAAAGVGGDGSPVCSAKGGEGAASAAGGDGGGHEAVLTDHRWRSPEGRMSQRQVAVAPPPSAAGPGRVLLVTATCEERLHAAWGSTFAAIVGSIRFRV
ncbi:hypothetical protein SOCEGT47_065860 [Sorangium cellulosum]|uniref:Uncharacterized protein n=1 Tax=Sorangium cellulosum TaxID=56 RepID=A0A4P2QAD9_SORCE|nr:type VI secretion system tip protein TssI/VgrG [Sorangium cellulosum]AUX26033.1 hypothetical protein SOCEGT47_065860 [Sorangium cellulosum]